MRIKTSRELKRGSFNEIRIDNDRDRFIQLYYSNFTGTFIVQAETLRYHFKKYPDAVNMYNTCVAKYEVSERLYKWGKRSHRIEVIP